MSADRPGLCVDTGPLIADLDLSAFAMRVPTDRYHARDHGARERDRLWMRVWQVAGRADELPAAGDWMEYRLFDQSYLLVRGKDGVIRGFVNACRHRGNALCEGKGHAARFTCPYHNWTYGLDGSLLAVAKPDFDGTIEQFVGAKDELGLVPVPVECFAGFIFLNPDRDAAPLADFLGETAALLAPYRLEEMIPVGLNVREALNCNWKVVVDAFQESYHVQGVHPELVGGVDLSRERCRFFGDHAATTVPFGNASRDNADPEQEVALILGLPPANFPGLAEALPRFADLVSACRTPAGALAFAEGVSARTLLQRAVRDTLVAKGLDVGGLTDQQMSDYQFWLIFPNVFLQVRAGEATAIYAVPHSDGDPNRCCWRVVNLQYVPPGQRAATRLDLHEVAAGDHFPYFLALEQDYEQMERQQAGLRNRTLGHMQLTKQEPKVAHFHATLDRWLSAVPAPR